MEEKQIYQLNITDEGEALFDIIGGTDNVKKISQEESKIVLELKEQLSFYQTELLKNSDLVTHFLQADSKLEFVSETFAPEQIVAQLRRIKKSNKTESLLDEAIAFISAVFTPLLPLFAGSGILKGLLILFVTLGWLAESSGTYLILASAANAVFQFLPILVAFATGRRLGVNPFIAALLSAALMEPALVSQLQGASSATLSFLGIPVVLMNYSATVIPAILATSFYALVEKNLKKFIGESFQLIILPLLSLMIVVPVTLIVFGPLGMYLGESLGWLVNHLLNSNGLLSGALIASGWLICVIFGLHWALYPIIIANIATIGFDTILPLTGVANFALAGATLAVLLKTKNAERKSIAISGFTSLFLAGIGEPSIYGIALPLKKPLIATCIGSAVGGGIAGLFQTQALALVFVSLPTLPAFLTGTFSYFISSIIVGFIVSFALTWFIGFDEEM